jgi:multimeric flavodoxin WrbA
MESIVRDLERLTRPLVLACSPRKGGNTDQAAWLLAKGLASAGADPLVVHLRDQHVLPCTGCQSCGPESGFKCVLMHRDQAESLFRLVLGAPMLFFASPIYFYHVPALFKGFIDRAQRYFVARNAGDPVLTAQPLRTAHAFLVGGRSRGERLFEGTLLSLRYFLWPFNATLGEDLCLYGIDEPDDLRRNETASARVEDFAFRAWKAGGQ